MADPPCTRKEANAILRGEIPLADIDPASKQLDMPNVVKRLQTLTDADLTVLSQSPDTFAIVESNRRFLNALQDEAARTTRLTRNILRLTVAVALIAAATLVIAFLTYRASLPADDSASRAAWGKWAEDFWYHSEKKPAP